MNINIFRLKRKNRIEFLKWWDILIITIILFGYFIWNSLLSFSNLTNSDIGEIPEFTSVVNWHAMALQIILLFLALMYLYFRNFYFLNWKIIINIKSILTGTVIFVGVALIFDLYFYSISYIFRYPNINDSIYYEAQVGNQLLLKLSSIDISLILYSILNGFYEEIFFLGICLSVKPKEKKYYFIYSLLVRYSFHTYQGNISAIAIAFLVGGIYYFLYGKMKVKNLFPFFLAHTITDILGAGILSYFF